MQLFITSLYIKHNNTIIINDERIVHQCFHVLRYKSGQTLQLQDNGVRHSLSITHISKKEIQTTITNTEEKENSTLNTSNSTLLIALPNRREKAELIVQKCTEIGVDQIIFWKAERSILRILSDKKLQRLQTIGMEASEQSFRRSLPTITYLDNLFESNILTTGKIVFFHQDGINISEIKSFKIQNLESIISIVGPEGGFSSQEYDYLSALPNCITINLGNTILRMETAAIVGSRLLKNL